MEFNITNDFHDVRLDKFLRKTYQHIPLSGISKMIRKGNVKVNKKKKAQNYRLQLGDTVRIWEATRPTAARSFLELSHSEKKTSRNSIVYEDHNILLCNKPPGLVMHSGSSHSYGLFELIRSYTKNPDFTFVHRIDKFTSGLVMGAKNLVTARRLSKIIQKRELEKKYIVLVKGQIDEKMFIADTYLKTEHDRVRVHPNGANGAKRAISLFLTLQHGKKHTLLEATLHSGRKHQLRAQLSMLGHSVVGDTKYGTKEQENHMFLFSHSLVVPSENINFSLPIPKIFYSKLNA